MEKNNKKWISFILSSRKNLQWKTTTTTISKRKDNTKSREKGYGTKKRKKEHWVWLDSVIIIVSEN